MPKDLLQARNPRPYVLVTAGWIIRPDQSRIHCNQFVTEFHGDNLLELVERAASFSNWHYVIRIRMEEFGSI